MSRRVAGAEGCASRRGEAKTSEPGHESHSGVLQTVILNILEVEVFTTHFMAQVMFPFLVSHCLQGVSHFK